MAHEFVRGFFRETPAWHKLGTVLQGTVSMADAVKLTKADSMVRKLPMYYRDESGNYHPAGNTTGPADDVAALDGVSFDRFATVREDGTYLGCVGARYEVLQDIEAFQFFQPLLDAGKVELDAGVILRGGRTLTITCRLTGDSGIADVLPGDPMYRYLVLTNSHDGWSAVTVAQTDVRGECANMTRRIILQSMSGDGSALRFKHTRTIRDGLEIAQKTIDLAAGTWGADVEVYRAMARRPMSGAEFRRYALVAMGKPEDSPVEEMHGKTQNILAKLEANFATFDGPIEGSGTVWAAYNAITRYVDHERIDDERRAFEASWGGNIPLRDKAYEQSLALLSA